MRKAEEKTPTKEQYVEEMARLGVPLREIAARLGISLSTAKRRKHVMEAWRRGLGDMRIDLRRAQIKTAMHGNVTMLIWLGKNLLGQRDNVTVDLDDDERLSRKRQVEEADKRLRELLAAEDARRGAAGDEAPSV